MGESDWMMLNPGLLPKQMLNKQQTDACVSEING